jgi:2-(1,2-epoxy-1,2-dihydrophenyl)acetyl-CoA isomerase
LPSAGIRENTEAMADDGRVTIDRDGPVAILTLERPARKNALAGSMREELSSHLEVISRDDAIGAIVVRGAGDAFCAGADLETLAKLQLAEDGAARLGAWLDTAAAVVIQLSCDVRQPTLAAIRGPAVGAGLGLALACDFRLAADDSRVATGFSALGLFADWGMSYFLPHRVGAARALDLALGTARLNAAQACAIGLVDEVVPAAEHERIWRERARSWADVARGAREGLVQALRQVDRAALQAALAREREAQLGRFRAPEVRSKVTAFLKRRESRA